MPNEPRGAAPAAALALSLLMWACALGGAPATPSAGETLYRRGLLSSAQPVQATREAGAVLRGADAACVNCHRRSGLGSIEGHIAIPPIAGPYLFVPRGEGLAQRGIPFVDTARINHDPYTDESLARAIRGEEALLITAEDALASVDVIEAAYADLRRSHWIPVERPQQTGIEEPALAGAVA